MAAINKQEVKWLCSDSSM